MKILLHDYGRHPYTVQLARSFSDRGHEVLYLYNGSELPRSTMGGKSENSEKLHIRGIFFSKAYNKWNLVKRFFQENEYGRKLAKEIAIFSPDWVISATTPLLAQGKAVSECKKRGIKFLFWVQDLQGLAINYILRRKIPILGAFAGRYFLYSEEKQIAGSDKIVLITDDFLPLIESWVKNKDDVITIPNWMPLDEMPLQPKDNDWSEKYNLQDKLCFVYTGVLGFKHNPELILKLAQQVEPEKNIRVVVVTDGLGANWLKQKKTESGIESLIVIDFQPFELMPKILGSADILFGVLEPEASEYSVPSKVSAYVCAGKPIIFSMNQNNLAAKIISKNNLGVVVPPGEDQLFLEAAKKLISDPELREGFGKNARAYAEEFFDIKKITDKFENLLNQSD